MSVCFRAIWTATPTGGSWPNAPVDERRLNGRSRAAKLTFGVIECTADKDRPPYGPLSSEHLVRRPRSTSSSECLCVVSKHQAQSAENLVPRV